MSTDEHRTVLILRLRLGVLCRVPSRELSRRLLLWLQREQRRRM